MADRRSARKVARQEKIIPPHPAETPVNGPGAVPRIGNQAIQKLARDRRPHPALLARLGNQAIQRVIAEAAAQRTGASGVSGSPAPTNDRPTPNQTGLPTDVLGKMEGFFQQDFSAVRVHADSSRADHLGARAFAQGNQVHFGPGEFQPRSAGGKQVIGHELAHVVQQGQGKVGGGSGTGGTRVNQDPALESEADRLGARAAGAGSSPSLAAQLSAVDGREPSRAGPTTTSDGGSAPIQLLPKSPKELLAMTVGQFDRHRKVEQMDWANQEFSERMRGAIWEIIDWGINGLGAIKLAAVVAEMLKRPESIPYLKNYCAALSGKIGSQPTVELKKLNTLPDILGQGKWVGELTGTLGGPLVRAVMPVEAFAALASDDRYATAFVDYYTKCKPTLQAPDGKDTWAFLELMSEGANIDSYRAKLPDIRNLHKFPKASLDKLVKDKGKKDKPLTLVLQSLYDHNGAFIRHEQTNKVIQNTRIRVFVLEGLNLDRLAGLQGSGLAELAEAHGMGGKITQVMFAGHGQSTMMELAGEGTQVKAKGSEYHVEPEGGSVSLAFDKSMGWFWTDFFQALFDNMEAKGGLQPTILLRACLTGSNEVDTQKLKELLKNVIDVDNPSVDPTTEENQETIRMGIVEYIKMNGSLAKVLGDKAGKRARVLGANASIDAATTGAIKEETGELDIIAVGDPMVAAPKIDYVRHGKEPGGALKAVIESWAEDRVKCHNAMLDRVADEVTSDDDFIINLLYQTILADYSNDILGANGFTRTASVLSGIGAGDAKCRPVRLKDDAMFQKHRGAFTLALLKQFKDEYAKLVLIEDWIVHKNQLQNSFLDRLGGRTFTWRKVQNYLDFGLLDAQVKQLLALDTSSLRGRIILALVGFIGNQNQDCADFLKAQVDDDEALIKEVKDELDGYNEDDLRRDLGLPVEAAPVVRGNRKKNITADGDFHVVPKRREVRAMTKEQPDAAKVRTEPRDEADAVEGTYLPNAYAVVGEVKNLKGADTGWSMIQLNNGKVAYIEKKFLT